MSPTLTPCKSKSTHQNYNLRPAIDVSRQELSIAGLKLNFGWKTKVLPCEDFGPKSVFLRLSQEWQLWYIFISRPLCPLLPLYNPVTTSAELLHPFWTKFELTTPSRRWIRSEQLPWASNICGSLSAGGATSILFDVTFGPQETRDLEQVYRVCFHRFTLGK